MKAIAILMLTIIFTGTAHSSMAATLTCKSYENKINHLQYLNAKGGKAKQQEARRKKISAYEEEYYKCSNIQKIKIVTNSQNHKIKTARQKLRTNKTQNPQLQQLISTCNYWLDQNNTNPSWDNTNFRDTACRAADEAEETLQNPAPLISPTIKKLKDCIKPNNLIDNEVNECLKGNREATWKT